MRALLVLGMLYLVVGLSAQNEKYQEGDLILLTKPLDVTRTVEALYKGVDTTKAVSFLEADFQYHIISIDGEVIKLMALDFKESASNSKLYNDIIYSVDKTKFEASYEKVIPTSRLTIGLTTIPYKARFKAGKFHSFDSEFSLNSTVNVNVYKSVNLIVGTGIGTVGLNTSNTSGGLTDNEAIDMTALSSLVGVMYDYKGIQIGVYTGRDFINNQELFQWSGHGKRWFALGIGYSLFKVISSEDSNN